MAKGLKKGNTNNLNGRPKGVQNKITTSVKEFLAQKVTEYMSEKGLDGKKFNKDIVEMTPSDRMRVMVDISKHIVPKAKDESEEEFEKMASNALRKRLFGDDKDE